MSLSSKFPPIEIPSALSGDKSVLSFMDTLLNILRQMWAALYSIRFSNKITTTDGTIASLMKITIPTNTSMLIDAKIIARRTGGSSGTAGDSAYYSLLGGYKNVAGTLTNLGSGVSDIYTDQAGWGALFSISGEDVYLVVYGATGNDITWQGTVYAYAVGA